ncbi:hypothetical protein NDU88_003615 [Pleurodeles waltl]|uniref:Uncharacterized protein n=1 Tax=Pleurodeles waltl TaxID=8319 RepID=A0AAV7KVE3_PLEWA|nr:hypothetical protein NDU88_003615 [Pleurodeles waltl]
MPIILVQRGAPVSANVVIKNALAGGCGLATTEDGRLAKAHRSAVGPGPGGEALWLQCDPPASLPRIRRERLKPGSPLAKRRVAPITFPPGPAATGAYVWMPDRGFTYDLWPSTPQRSGGSSFSRTAFRCVPECHSIEGLQPTPVSFPHKHRSGPPHPPRLQQGLFDGRTRHGYWRIAAATRLID